MKIVVIENRADSYKVKITDAVLSTLRQYPCEVVSCEYGQQIPACDLVVVLGGDGTILRIAKQLCDTQTPLIGVNLGRVGYLAELEACDIARLGELFSQPWQIEERMMLDVITAKQTISVLNDLVIRRPFAAGIARIGAYHNDIYIGSYYADGVIVATPTGSTAYALSAGGAVLDPALSCLSLTPICPTGGNGRCLVFGADSTVRLRNLCRQPSEVCLVADGTVIGDLLLEEDVRVCRSKKTAHFLHLKKDSFCNTLRNKVLGDEAQRKTDVLEGEQ